MPANVFRRLIIADPFPVAQRDIADIFIKAMLQRIAKIVRFICPYRVLIPFAGKHALSAYRFKSAANTADAREKIDKTKGVMRMMRWRRRQPCFKKGEFIVAQTMPCRVHHYALEDDRAPVLLAQAVKVRHQRFNIVDFQQLTQHRLDLASGVVGDEVPGVCY